MKIIKRISIVILALIIIAWVSLYAFRAKIISNYMPVVEQMGEIHIQIKNDTSYVSSKLSVENKSFIKINIDTIKYKVLLFDQVYLQNQKSLGLVLPVYGKDTVDFSLKIPHT